jgi:hypothetical protein
MFCNQCGKPNPDDSRFCRFCGSAMTSDRQPAAPAAEWEYQDFVLDYSQTGLGARLADSTLITTTRVELWAQVRPEVMKHLQSWLDKGWQPVAQIGPDCLEFKEQRKRELGGGLALFGVNTYVYLQTVRIQMRRQKAQPAQAATAAAASAAQGNPSAAPARSPAELTELVLQEMVTPLDKDARAVRNRLEKTLTEARSGHMRTALSPGCTLLSGASRACKRLNVPLESVPVVRDLVVFGDLNTIENELEERWLSAKNAGDAALLLRDLTILAEQGLDGLIEAPTGIERERWVHIVALPGVSKSLEWDYLRYLMMNLQMTGKPVPELVKLNIRTRLGEKMGDYIIQVAYETAQTPGDYGIG